MGKLTVIIFFTTSALSVYLGLSNSNAAPFCFAVAIFAFGMGIAAAVQML